MLASATGSVVVGMGVGSAAIMGCGSTAAGLDPMLQRPRINATTSRPATSPTPLSWSLLAILPPPVKHHQGRG